MVKFSPRLSILNMFTEMWCKECQRKYRGQTGVSADERIGKHFEDWKRKLETCPLHRHSTTLSSRKTISGRRQNSQKLFW